MYTLENKRPLLHHDWFLSKFTLGFCKWTCASLLLHGGDSEKACTQTGWARGLGQGIAAECIPLMS